MQNREAVLTAGGAVLAAHMVFLSLSIVSIFAYGIGVAYVASVVLTLLILLTVIVGAVLIIFRNVRPLAKGALAAAAVAAGCDFILMFGAIVVWFSLHPGAELS